MSDRKYFFGGGGEVGHKTNVRIDSEGCNTLMRNHKHTPDVQPRLTLIGPMLSYTRRRFHMYREQCRVTLDSDFTCTGYKVELHSTAISHVPGTMSSYTR